MMQRPILPVTKNLLIINVALFVVTSPIFGPVSPFESLTGVSPGMLCAYFPASGTGLFEPYQIVTSMFMHATFLHLAFNMYALWMFGSIVEGSLGAKRFFIYYFVCGFGALLLHWLATYAFAQMGNPQMVMFDSGAVLPREYAIKLLGASGAIYGILVAFAYIAPNAILQLIIPPIPVKAKYLVGGLIVIDLYLGLGRYNSGIAHFAHLGGALIGFILLVVWSRRGGLYAG